jgi:glutamate-ammonia-ligase adenylyltransferase
VGITEAATMIEIDAKSLPKAADAARAATGLERWNETVGATDADSRGAAAIASDATGHAILESIFGNSPYLGQLLLREPNYVADFLSRGPDALFPEILAATEDTFGEETSLERLMSGLRQAKRRAALTIGLADILGLWPLERITRGLSDFADLALRLAIRNLLRRFAGEGVITLPDGPNPERDSGLVVLALGKLGAHELNYSSDIDIMVLYEPEKLRPASPDRLPQELVRLTRLLVRILDERTADGYVFRTDLRLRPDPGATPLAIPIVAAETYYESVGQNWERAAMIRARAAAGDIELGDDFLHHLRPFIWRKNLDFAAIQDIHSIKRQIAAYRGGAEIAVNGHNVKLGRGGIREIEFFVQTQQLIWGGRYPELRETQVCAALDALAAHQRIAVETAEELAAAYRYLRRLEHRLQMIEDQQTHEIPKTDEQVEAVALFMGYANGAQFREELLSTLSLVENHYAQLFEEAPDLGAKRTLVFTGTENHPETVQTLEEMGFTDGGSVSTVIRNWHHGRYRAMRSVRARELLTEFMPHLLQAFAERSDPNAALTRFDAFLGGLPAGVQLFSLFYTNPQLLDLVAEIMGDAPHLADWLRRRPHLLDNVLSHDFFQPPETDLLAPELEAALAQAGDYQDVLDITRRWTNDRKFQTGVQLLRGTTDGDQSGPVLTAVAETVIRALWPHVARNFAEQGGQHGYVAGGTIAVIALGKLGSRELLPGSDLDLVLVYDTPEESEASDGERPLATSVYFMRLSQRIVGAIEAPTGEGRLYDVDTRLRPSGNRGPAVTRLDGYIRYYVESAWTWEKMALTRARVVAGAPSLVSRLEEEIRAVLLRPIDPDRLLVDVADMRSRIRKEHKGDSRWDIKHRPGGLVDGEFIAQYLQLRHAPDRPDILSPSPVAALENIGASGLVEPGIASDIAESLRLWHRVQAILRITSGEGLDDETGPKGPREALVRATGCEDFSAARDHMDTAAARVHDYFNALVAQPAEEARQRLDGKTQTGD